MSVFQEGAVPRLKIQFQDPIRADRDFKTAPDIPQRRNPFKPKQIRCQFHMSRILGEVEDAGNGPFAFNPGATVQLRRVEG